MSNKKHVPFTPEETKLLTDLPNASRKKLQVLANKWKRESHSVYNKWWRIHNSKVTAPIVTPVSVMKHSIEPMEFIIDETITSTRADTHEVTSMKLGLDKVINQLGVRKGAIAIKKHLRHHASQYLKASYPEKAFVFSKVPDSDTDFRIIRSK